MSNHRLRSNIHLERLNAQLSERTWTFIKKMSKSADAACSSTKRSVYEWLSECTWIFTYLFVSECRIFVNNAINMWMVEWMIINMHIFICEQMPCILKESNGWCMWFVLFENLVKFWFDFDCERCGVSLLFEHICGLTDPLLVLVLIYKCIFVLTFAFGFGFEQCVFLWNASTGATQKLLETTVCICL